MKRAMTPNRSHWARVQILRLAAAASVLAVWWYGAGPGNVSPIILPKPVDVVGAFLGRVTSPDLYHALAITLAEIVTSLLVAGLAGFLVGFWAARSEFRSSVIEPLLVWGYLVPLILFYPLLILWFGIGLPSKIAYAALSAFFPIALNCLRAFASVDVKYISLARAFGASPTQLDWLIKLRAGVPVAAAGLRLGAAISIITVIVAEMLASSEGLGYLLKIAAESFSTADVYALIAVILLVVGILHIAIGLILPPAANSGAAAVVDTKSP